MTESLTRGFRSARALTPVTKVVVSSLGALAVATVLGAAVDLESDTETNDVRENRIQESQQEVTLDAAFPRHPSRFPGLSWDAPREGSELSPDGLPP